MTTPSIADHGLLSNCQGSALVTREGDIDWACLPSFDAQPTFAGILDPDAGHWSLRPVDREATATRRYLDDTMVIATTWRTDEGEVEVRDLLPLGPTERPDLIGLHARPAVLRVVEGISGTVEMETVLEIRPEFGVVLPRFREVDGGLIGRGGSAGFAIAAPPSVRPHAPRCAGRFEVVAGHRVALEVRQVDPWNGHVDIDDQQELLAIADDTMRDWRRWSASDDRYDGAYGGLVRHSGRVLHALTYAPTGAIVAAPTTSLPEELGGSRNWDYRCAWVRDASLTLEAISVSSRPEEARRLFDFFLTAAGSDLQHERPLQVVYGIRGERHLPEVEVPHMRGFAGSRPIRLGNAAWAQLQLDVYGELLDAADLLLRDDRPLDESTAEFLVALADAVVQRWQEPDHGIWEVRSEARQHVYSKVMCWVALERGLHMAEALGVDESTVDRWRTTRDEIRSAVDDRGWNDDVGSYVQTLDGDELDAANLRLLVVGYLQPDDPRARATVEAISSGLSDDQGFVYRYRSEDGMSGDEGTFALCTLWLSHCRALLGELDEAERLLDLVVGRMNDLMLLSEEIDPDSGEMLGNFPQAFTHIGIINAARAIDRARWDGGLTSEEDDRSAQDAAARTSS